MASTGVFLLPFERDFHLPSYLDWMHDNWYHGFYCTGIYIITVLAMEKWMQDKKAWDLRRWLIIWNGAMALFSTVASWRVMPIMLEILLKHGLMYSVCAEELLDDSLASGFWMWAYVVSKVVEFGDTVFMVLRKRPLTFLHVFHHTMTLISSWYGFAHRCGIGRWFVAINFFVHSFMYFYFMLKGLGFHIHRNVSIAITSGQIAQMFLGFYIAVRTLIHVMQPNILCTTNLTGCIMCTFMYVSYIFLFSKFFYTSYIVPRKKRQSLKSE